MKLKYVLIIFFILVVVVIVTAIYYNPPSESSEQDSCKDSCLVEDYTPEVSNNLSRLEKLLDNLTNSTFIENGVCLDYALYYLEFLNMTYPNLDVRRVDMAGICPIGTKECGDMEGMAHTYVIVNGWGTECILDQRHYTCLNIRRAE